MFSHILSHRNTFPLYHFFEQQNLLYFVSVILLQRTADNDIQFQLRHYRKYYLENKYNSQAGCAFIRKRYAVMRN